MRIKGIEALPTVVEGVMLGMVEIVVNFTGGVLVG